MRDHKNIQKIKMKNPVIKYSRMLNPWLKNELSGELNGRKTKFTINKNVTSLFSFAN